jgi:type I restriction enzyme M protein
VDDDPFAVIVSGRRIQLIGRGDANPLFIDDPRFWPAGALAAKSKADLASAMHMLAWPPTAGTAGIMEFSRRSPSRRSERENLAVSN